MAAPVDYHAEQSQNAHSLPVNVEQGNSYPGLRPISSNPEYVPLSGEESSDFDDIIWSLSGDMSLSDTRLAELIDRLTDWAKNGVPA